MKPKLSRRILPKSRKKIRSYGNAFGLLEDGPAKANPSTWWLAFIKTLLILLFKPAKQATFNEQSQRVVKISGIY
jgi:hypothetical protein